MLPILLTQYDGMIVGPIAKLLGYIMEGIFFVLDKLHIPNVGLAIILFTIVIYLLMLPLTIKQQKFSKLSAKMNPELQEIQAKYKNRKDQDSMAAMQQETQAVYHKYGVSPTGSCVQLIIQMPILFALYRVIESMPAYVGRIKEAFYPLVEKISTQPDVMNFVTGLSSANYYQGQINNEAFTSGNATYVQNTLIDILNRASSADWTAMADKFPNLATDIQNTAATLDQYNNFLGLNIGNSPSFTLSQAISSGAYIMIIAALAIPVLSALTQWLNVKLMPTAQSQSGQDNSMAASMKMMNNIMPIMSAVFCFTLPAGLGLYWVAGAVVRSIQQVAINKHIDKMDIDAEIKKNVEKRNKKLKKAGIDPEKLNSYATMNTRKVTTQSPAANKPASKASTMTQAEKEEAVKKATEYYNKNAARPGSIAAKANMVRDYNEKNNRK